MEMKTFVHFGEGANKSVGSLWTEMDSSRLLPQLQNGILWVASFTCGDVIF